MSKLRLLGTAVLIGAAVCTMAPAPASANGFGYVCRVFYSGDTSILGDHGYIYYSVYSGTYCSGTYLGSGRLCSEGRSYSYPYCAINHEFPNADTLIDMLGIMTRAAEQNQKIYYYGTLSSSSNPVRVLEFTAY